MLILDLLQFSFEDNFEWLRKEIEMTISEFIEELQKIMDEHGDVPVVVQSYDEHDDVMEYSDAWLEYFDKETSRSERFGPEEGVCIY